MASTSLTVNKPIVVVGSVNADIYVEVERLPAPGETVAAKTGRTLPGGKGANQAACAAKLGAPCAFVGQVGNDANGTLVVNSLVEVGVNIDRVTTLEASPTGHAIVILQSGGQNSILIVGGANANWRAENNRYFSPSALEAIQSSGALLLQREIPELVNLEAATAAKEANVPVILDAGGEDSPISTDLLSKLSILSPNETELHRLTDLPTSTTSDVIDAAKELQKAGVSTVLVKLGAQGSIYVGPDNEVIIQPAVPCPSVVDTTGAGDTFTASFAVSVCEGQSAKNALLFATAAASLCIQKMGALPSMPDREAVDALVAQLQAK